MSCPDFGIGVTAGTIYQLPHVGIPNPDSHQYTPYTRVETTWSGMRKGYGFPTATWKWDTLTQFEINRLLGYITGNEASAQVYLSTAIDTGPMRTFDDFSGILDRIVDGQGKTIINRSALPSYSGVTVTFTHLVVL